MCEVHFTFTVGIRELHIWWYYLEWPYIMYSCTRGIMIDRFQTRCLWIHGQSTP